MQLHFRPCGFFPLFLLFLISALQYVASQQAGDVDYYANTCPNAESLVRSSLRGIFARDVTAPAAMSRLLFHDCQVNGCDASILLDNGSDGTTELEAPANLGIRRLDIIDTLKRQLEGACPQTVSCADIIAMAARDAIAISGGPDISIPLGRLDGFDASSDTAQSDLPPATISIPDMLDLFSNMGMNVEESVSMLGAHTLGVAHCSNFANRLYPLRDPNLSVLFASSLMARCPVRFPTNAFAALDTTNFRFDNIYFKNLVNGRGLLTIDSILVMDPTTGPIVQNFADNPNAFFDTFSTAFVKLSSFRVDTGSQGEVRTNCHFPNS